MRMRNGKIRKQSNRKFRLFFPKNFSLERGKREDGRLPCFLFSIVSVFVIFPDFVERQYLGSSGLSRPYKVCFSLGLSIIGMPES